MAVAVAAVGVLALGAHAASAGVLEICKDSSNGMSGRTFTFTVTPTSGSSFTRDVKAGFCSGPITVGTANATVTEASTIPATEVQKIDVRPSAKKLSENLGARTVTVATGASTASETLIRFFNQPPGGTGGTLKLCKLTRTPAFLGHDYSFSVNGGPIVSTPANDAFDDPANWSCRILGTFPVGTDVSVQEQIPPGQRIEFIDTDPPSALGDFNTLTGSAVVHVGAGTTILMYDNEPIPPSGTGFIEVCKNFGDPDPDVTGAFNFTVTDSAGVSYPVTANAGFCAPAIQVAAGIATVTEAAKAGSTLADITTNPSDRLLDANLINRTATVEVPASLSPNDETQVFFVNLANRGQLKVCKVLGPASGDLVDQVFPFTASGSNGQIVQFTIQASTTPQCKVVGLFPIGSTVTVTEDIDHSPMAPGEFIDTTGEGPVVIKAGVNQVDITNTARGLLEVCKARVVDFLPTVPQPTFQFRIDGGAIFTVQAGTCSTPRRVSVGNHSVTEVAASDYELLAINVNPSNRVIVSAPAQRTITVSVPFGDQETAVTFINRVKVGQVKVCKQIPITSLDSLGAKEWTFDVFIQVGPGPADIVVERLGPIRAGECTSFNLFPYPILTQQGTRRAIGVHENDPLGLVRNVNYKTTAITTTGTRGLCFVTDPGVNTTVCPYPVGSNPSLVNGDIDFYLGPGPNTVTYTNQALDP